MGGTRFLRDTRSTPCHFDETYPQNANGCCITFNVLLHKIHNNVVFKYCLLTVRFKFHFRKNELR